MSDFELYVLLLMKAGSITFKRIGNYVRTNHLLTRNFEDMRVKVRYDGECGDYLEI
jgi:hypothetical protein